MTCRLLGKFSNLKHWNWRALFFDGSVYGNFWQTTGLGLGLEFTINPPSSNAWNWLIGTSLRGSNKLWIDRGLLIKSIFELVSLFLCTFRKPIKGWRNVPFTKIFPNANLFCIASWVDCSTSSNCKINAGVAQIYSVCRR